MMQRSQKPKCITYDTLTGLRPLSYFNSEETKNLRNSWLQVNPAVSPKEPQWDKGKQTLFWGEKINFFLWAKHHKLSCYREEALASIQWKITEDPCHSNKLNKLRCWFLGRPRYMQQTPSVQHKAAFQTRTQTKKAATLILIKDI